MRTAAKKELVQRSDKYIRISRTAYDGWKLKAEEGIRNCCMITQEGHERLSQPEETSMIGSHQWK